MQEASKGQVPKDSVTSFFPLLALGRIIFAAARHPANPDTERQAQQHKPPVLFNNNPGVVKIEKLVHVIFLISPG
jgi:hypothetical protein